MQKVDGKDIAWLLRCKECSKTLKIKDVKETITGDFNNLLSSRNDRKKV